MPSKGWQSVSVIKAFLLECGGDCTRQTERHHPSEMCLSDLMEPDRATKTITLSSFRGGCVHWVGQALKARGYDRLVLQVGRGSLLPTADNCPRVTLEAFRFKDSIAEDIQQADLVISHAGAGSCLETLGAGKPLLVVVNDKLMDNHQLELARQLHMDSHLLYCTCSTLTETLRTMDLSVLQPFSPGQPKTFANFLDKALGVQ